MSADTYPTTRFWTRLRDALPDGRARRLAAAFADVLNVPAESLRVWVVDVYLLALAPPPEGPDAGSLQNLAESLFGDPITSLFGAGADVALDFEVAIEVGYRPGVRDNVAATIRDALPGLLGRALLPGEHVATRRITAIAGLPGEKDTHDSLGHRLAAEVLANDLIERSVVLTRAAYDTGERFDAVVPTVILEAPADPVSLIKLPDDDAALATLSRERLLALSVPEMRAIKAWLDAPATQAMRQQHGLPADAVTDVELECLAQTWSEHCKHKIFNATITVLPEGTNPALALPGASDLPEPVSVVESVFKTYIHAPTKEIMQTQDELVSVFHDNAGVVRMGEGRLVAAKVETHNSPSALDPFGGAITGVLGVNRDILGTGVGCLPIANTDMLCFGPPDHADDLPKGLLPPRRVLTGVHRGIQAAGNESGIPIVNGSITFHERFLGKPLVYCGTFGVMPETLPDGRSGADKTVLPGDIAIMVGGRVGKDGIHGATFSSLALEEHTPASVVQIGDSYTQRNLIDLLLDARDKGLVRTLTDNGAGGLSSSVGELAERSGGAVLDLATVPLKYAGLLPWEILVSESQERMSIVVPPEHEAAFHDLAKAYSVEATSVGRFTGDGVFTVRHGERIVAALDIAFLHEGLPRMSLTAIPRTRPVAEMPESRDLGEDLTALLAQPTIRSKETLVRQFDHEVQARSVVKPFAGQAVDGPSDAGVMRFEPDGVMGLAVSHGLVPRLSDLDAYAMAQAAVDEAVRSLVATGVAPHPIYGLDNFCWPDPVPAADNPEGPGFLADLVDANRGLADACRAMKLPCVSGKDSMKNDFRGPDGKISILPTLLFTAFAPVADVTKCVTTDAKEVGDALLMLGVTGPHLGASEWAAMHGVVGGDAPRLDLDRQFRLYSAVHALMQAGKIRSCHDCSDGGLAVTLCETLFGGTSNLGALLDLDAMLVEGEVNTTARLFGETPGRLLATVADADVPAVQRQLQDASVPFAFCGRIMDDGMLNVVHGKASCMTLPVADLKGAWQMGW